MSDREFRDMQRSLTRSPRKPKDAENKPRINNGSYQPHSFAMQWNYEESTENAASSASSTTVKKQILPKPSKPTNSCCISNPAAYRS